MKRWFQIPFGQAAALAILTGFLSYLVPLLNLGRTLGNDWRYYSSHPLFIASSILGYHKLPLQDPWACGGIDFFANAQSRVFSPMVVLGLFFGPDLANLLLLVVYGVFGAFGAFVLLRDLGVARSLALVVGGLFLNCGWFTLHYSEGHVALGCLQLLPWIGYCARKPGRPGRLLGLLSLLTLFLLDGGFYVFVFSLGLILSFHVPALWDRPSRAVLIPARKDYLFSFGCILSAVLLSSAKIIPVLSVNGATREIEYRDVRIPLEKFATVFLNPFHTNLEPSNIHPRLNFHEFGCYIGFLGLFVIFWALWQPGFFARARRWLGLLIFWFWVGTGIGPFNPWQVMEHLPLFNDLQIQPRFLILFVFVYVVVLGLALEVLRKRAPRICWLVTVVLLLEALFVRSKTFTEVYALNGRPAIPWTLISSNTVSATLRFAYRPEHYLRANLGSRECYESPRLSSSVKILGYGDYHGEAYVAAGEGDVRLGRYIPGELHLLYNNSSPVRAIVNTNYLGGWRVADGEGFAARTEEGLLAVELPRGRGEIRLDYAPAYLVYVMALYAAGVLLWCWLLGRLLFHGHRPASG